LQDYILDIVVPMEEQIEIKDGKKKASLKKVFPGYVLVKMIMNDESWYVVRNTRGVTGFVGPGSKAVPLTDEEIRLWELKNLLLCWTMRSGQCKGGFRAFGKLYRNS